MRCFISISDSDSAASFPSLAHWHAYSFAATVPLFLKLAYLNILMALSGFGRPPPLKLYKPPPTRSIPGLFNPYDDSSVSITQWLEMLQTVGRIYYNRNPGPKLALNKPDEWLHNLQHCFVTRVGHMVQEPTDRYEEDVVLDFHYCDGTTAGKVKPNDKRTAILQVWPDQFQMDWISLFDTEVRVMISAVLPSGCSWSSRPVDTRMSRLQALNPFRSNTEGMCWTVRSMQNGLASASDRHPPHMHVTMLDCAVLAVTIQDLAAASGIKRLKHMNVWFATTFYLAFRALCADRGVAVPLPSEAEARDHAERLGRFRGIRLVDPATGSLFFGADEAEFAEICQPPENNKGTPERLAEYQSRYTQMKTAQPLMPDDQIAQILALFKEKLVGVENAIVRGMVDSHRLSRP
ncbi:hypothetical protein MIND_01379200 [Mycena indigotica]|uniref:Uncharacterized protein n=1 Tax=Mycena indigotica TaxID=2126181 RepID=A0A8H6RZD7_9AGAR|nr:uncharacterized protein MIND_01379200 [Mycena indigotica]KAF7289181.1 hypothetical protein MIND_01379200 [Mycena indigotica]